MMIYIIFYFIHCIFYGLIVGFCLVVVNPYNKSYFVLILETCLKVFDNASKLSIAFYNHYSFPFIFTIFFVSFYKKYIP